MADRIALIIANSEFEDSKLTELATPSRDAEALAEVLSDPEIGGFQVAKLLDEPLRTVRREISRLYRRRKRGDLLLLYYSGHGFKDDFGELYLAVRDTEHETLDATALEAAFVRGRLDQSSSQRKVVILDCCHSGAFGRGAMSVLGTNVGTGEALIGSGYGVVVLTATDSVQYAWEQDRVLGDAEASVFTHFLVQGLQTGNADLDGDGDISHNDLYEYVYDQVLRSGVTKQTPLMLAPRVEGRIVIARNPHRTVEQIELPQALQQAIKSPYVSLRQAAVRELGHLLQAGDKDLALVAQEALQHLLDDDSRRVSAAAAQALGVSPKPSATAKPEPKPELHPSLALKLSVKPEIVAVGDEAKWTVTLRNDGDDELRDVTVNRGKKPLSEPFSLAQGKRRRFAFKTKNETRGMKTEKVTASGTATSGKNVHTETSATLQVRPLRAEPAPDKDRMIWPADDKKMVRVRAGTFHYGEKGKRLLGITRHPRLNVPEFWIDETPVTNAEYAHFVADTRHEPPKHWKGKTPPQEIANHPVTWVNWHDAVVYAEWAGKRLPTEEEWEKAARGTDGRDFPWGDQKPTLDLCNFGENEGGTTPVGHYSPQGDSPYGCVDMAGNVWEWTASDHEDGGKVLRGGAWRSGADYVRSVIRSGLTPVLTSRDWGFRCVTVITPSQ